MYEQVKNHPARTYFQVQVNLHAMTMRQEAQSPHLQVVLDDLCTRFLLNLPATEFESFERLFFAVESAHWFYDDFYREKHSILPKLPLKAFAQKLFDHTPLLQPYSADVDKLIADFKHYKQEVPTCGAAMLNTTLDKVVLVRGWGSGAKWGFPKGKVSKDETELQAAIREVQEETGFDLTNYVDSSTHFLDSMMYGRLNRIFVVPGVPEDAKFETQTRKEISKIDWIPVSTLPAYKDKQQLAKEKSLPSSSPPKKNSPGIIPANKFIHVHPYTYRLRSWIRRERKRRARTNNTGTSRRVTGGSNGAHNDVTNNLVERNEKPLAEVSSRIPEGSPKSKRSRKNRGKQRIQETKKDEETFGSCGGSRALTNAERDNLFQKYLLDAEKRTRELKLDEEDGWLSSGSRPMLPQQLKPTNPTNQPFTFDVESILARMHREVDV